MADNGTLEDIYKKLCSYENLEAAYNKAKNGKTQKQYVREFEEKLKENLTRLRTELLMQSYHPQPLKTFILRDPKTRKISKSAFRDRVVHHAICNLIEPAFDKRFIHDSYANRIGKGTLNAIKRFDEFKRKVSKNNTLKCYVLKADIKDYFGTVNRATLLDLLRKRIKDDRVMWLIERIITNYRSKDKNKGMPLGNLTSQFFANVYLNELDQYLKHKLRARYYIRYVDDFVILHPSRRTLEQYKSVIDKFLREKLDLKLHPDKSQILKLEKGIGFLGFRIFYHHKLLARKNMRRFEKKMEGIKHEYSEGKIDREKVIERLEGWLAYASHANTHKYRKRLTSKFNCSFPARQEMTISSVKKHENFSHKIEASKIEFSQQKTSYLLKNGKTIRQIAELRGIREGTVWAHIARLIENHQVALKSVIPTQKITAILASIKSPDDKLKDIKDRLTDDSISYDEIDCVIASIIGKHKKKSINYLLTWYRKTNCARKCYHNKNQRQECRMKFQQLAVNSIEIRFTRNEFLEFFNNHVTICALPESEKKRIMSWKEFKQQLL